MQPRLYKFFFLVTICIVLNSCAQGDDDPNPNGPGKPAGPGSYYMRFEANGVPQDYNITYAKLRYDADNLAYAGILTGQITPTKNTLTIFLWNKEEYVTGKKYILTNEILLAETNTISPQISIGHADAAGKQYAAVVLPSTGHPYVDDAELIFTEITNEHVKGTFSASLYSDIPEREKLELTDGEFFMARN